ncbi:MAG: hypothetical protein AB7E32_16935 [Desulfovibrio sp.]
MFVRLMTPNNAPTDDVIGFYALLDEDGTSVTRYTESTVWPYTSTGEPSGLSGGHEHPEGIYLDAEQVAALGLDID